MLHKSLLVQPHVVPAQVLALILHLMKSQKELIRTLIIRMQPELFYSYYSSQLYIPLLTVFKYQSELKWIPLYLLRHDVPLQRHSSRKFH